MTETTAPPAAETDAAFLRRAAAHLRVHAGAATVGPWVSLSDGDRLIHEFDDGTDRFEYVVGEPISNAANAEYIALMDPLVGSALADLLDRIADEIQERRDGMLELGLGALWSVAANPTWTTALKAARKIFGEAAR